MLERKLSVLLAAAALILSATVAPRAQAAISIPTDRAVFKATAGESSAHNQAMHELLARNEEAIRDVALWLRGIHAAGPPPESMVEQFFTIRVEHRFKSLFRFYSAHRDAHGTEAEAELIWRELESDWVSLIAAIRHWEEGRVENPRDAEPWTELGHYFHHNGPSSAMITCFEKAVALDPFNPELNREYATSIFLFRRDARNLYDLTEQGVFDRALRYFRRALICDPDNFELARDLASSYSVIKPTRIEDALAAWNRALGIAQNPLEREDAHINLARIEIRAGNVSKAREHLAFVSSPIHADIRARIERTIANAGSRAELN